MEHAATLTQKKKRGVLKVIVSTLKSKNYQVRFKNMNGREHGLPQQRTRLYLMAILKDDDDANDERVFKWPAPIPLKVSTSDIIVRRTTMDDPHRLPPVGESPTAKRQRQLVKNSYRKHFGDGVNPARKLIFTDIGCSLTHATLGEINILPCMTASRACQLDWWVSLRGGKIDLDELMAFQGVDPDAIAGWRHASPPISDRQMGYMLGNGLAMCCFERLRVRALWCSGLVSRRIKDPGV